MAPPRSQRVRTLLERQLEEAERLESEVIMKKRALKKQLESQSGRMEVVNPGHRPSLPTKQGTKPLLNSFRTQEHFSTGKNLKNDQAYYRMLKVPAEHSKFSSSNPRPRIHSVKTIPKTAHSRKFLSSSAQEVKKRNPTNRSRGKTKESDPDWVPSSETSSIFPNGLEVKGMPGDFKVPVLSVPSDAFTDGSMLSPITTERSTSIPSSMELDAGILYDMRSTPGSRSLEDTEKRQIPGKIVEHPQPSHTSGRGDKPTTTSSANKISNTGPGAQTFGVVYEPVVEVETDYITFIPQRKRRQQSEENKGDFEAQQKQKQAEKRREAERQMEAERQKEEQKQAEAQKHRESQKQRELQKQSHPTSNPQPQQYLEGLQQDPVEQSLGSFLAMKQQMISIQKQLAITQQQMQAMLPVFERFSGLMHVSSPGLVNEIHHLRTSKQLGETGKNKHIKPIGSVHHFDSDREESWGVRSSTSFRLEGADKALPSIEVDDDLTGGLIAMHTLNSKQEITGPQKGLSQFLYSHEKRKSTSLSSDHPPSKKIKSESMSLSEASPQVQPTRRKIYAISSVSQTPPRFQSTVNTQLVKSQHAPSRPIGTASTTAPAPSHSQQRNINLRDGVTVGGLRLVTPMTLINKSASPSPGPFSSSTKLRNPKIEEVKRALRISPTTFPLPSFSPSRRWMYTPSSIASAVTSSPTPPYNPQSSQISDPKPTNQENPPPNKKVFQIKRRQQSPPEASEFLPSGPANLQSPYNYLATNFETVLGRFSSATPDIFFDPDSLSEDDSFGHDLGVTDGLQGGDGFGNADAELEIY